MRKRRRFVAFVLTVLLGSLLPATMARGQIGSDLPDACWELVYSTEEDFVTQGPEPPDGNPVISDGDLLGLNGIICARNEDLLHNTFDVSDDLGLDAADVLPGEGYVVAFSTELDSPNQDQFTAGDLLVTRGIIIPNLALTHLFVIGYAIGLDAVHFVGTDADILSFLDEVGQYDRAYWLDNLGNLSQVLNRRNVDIWFSIEGTFKPLDAPMILDGDLLSASTGTIVAHNSDVLPLNVPAGIPSRGVDFGLDAATTTRTGDKRLIHFSTEILSFGETAFTDGDILAYKNGVVAKNIDLIGPFEPKARDLGLDALSVSLPVTRPCVSRLTHVAGVAVADINPDGMAISNTVGSPLIPALVPFGGEIDIQGNLCDDVERFRVLYQHVGSGSTTWTSIGVPAGDGWKVKADGFFPPGPDCLASVAWFSDGTGWYDGMDYRHFTQPALGGCNPGLALTVWDSENAAEGADDLYALVLETVTPGGTVTSTQTFVQLDNTPPQAELFKDPGTCDAFTESDMPLTVQARITDTHFYRYRLNITGDSYGDHDYPSVAYYDDPTDNVVEDGTKNQPLFQDLHDVDVDDLAFNPVECGYTVRLTAWERTLWTNFNFPGNQAYRHPGRIHVADDWTFNYTP